MNTYLALYRKYRPTTFADLVGQEAVAGTLSRALTQGRLSHAYLFCGPRGTGKTSVARILAKSVNCEQGPTDTPCGTCANCQDITAGHHLDVIEIDAASNNGVDNIRDLQDRVALAPVAGRWKVYIIDEVHMLSQGAFNALLKTLEEPPSGVMFILATTDPHKVLPTIVSRCQRFDFGRIPLARLVERLAYVAAAEGIAGDVAAWEAIARRANGGLRDALSLLDQLGASAGGAPLTPALVARGLGLLAGDQVVTLAGALLQGGVPDVLAQVAALLAAGHDHGAIVRELMVHVRHLMVLQMAPEAAAALEVPTAQLETLRLQAAGLSPAEIAWMLDTLNETDAMLRRSPQQTIWLELGLIKLTQRPNIPSVSELAERVTALEQALQAGVVLTAPGPGASRPSPVPPPPTARPAPPPSASQAEPPAAAPPAAAAVSAEEPPGLPPRPPLGVLSGGQASPAPTAPQQPVARAGRGGPNRPVPPGAWDRVHAYVRGRSVPTAALLAQKASIVAWESDGAVVLRMAKPFKEQFERQAAKKNLLVQALQDVFGADAYLRIDTGEGAVPGRDASSPAPLAPPLRALPTEDEPPPPAEPISLMLDEEPPPPPTVPAPRPQTMPVAALPPGQAPGFTPPVGPQAEDDALRMVTEIFNGRVIVPVDA